MPLITSALRSTNSRDLSLELERAIHSGELRPGETLPSIRALAEATSLSPTTVSSALGRLRRRGLLRSLPRRGVQVATLENRLDRSGLRDLRHGGPDPMLLPDLRPSLRRATEELATPRSYSFPLLDPELGSLAQGLFAADGIAAEQIVACSGALDGIQRVLTLSLGPGDPIALEDPGYADHYELVRALGLRPIAVAVDDEGVRPDALEVALDAGAKALVLTPAGQNPFGSLLTTARAAALRLVLAGRPDVLVIEDQHLSLLIRGAASLAGSTDRWVAVRTLAKALGADLRVALLTGDPQTTKRVAERISVGPGWTSHILQRTAYHLLTDDAVLTRLAEMAAAYDRRRNALLDALRDRSVEAYGRSGLNVWVPVSDEGDIAVRLAEIGWTVATGSAFRIASGPAIRITAATLNEDDATIVADDVERTLARDVGRRG